MDDTFLLYIDILGFSEMTRQNPRKVARLYAILDSLNAHKHGSFKTIVFSDTVVIYNPMAARSKRDRQYLVWYLTEFAEDLHHRLTGQDVYFRAVITAGQFNHYNLKNLECFYGEALINAYLREKRIPSVGLFMDSRCLKYNQYFKTFRFEKDLHFVYLNRSLDRLDGLVGGVYPADDAIVSDLCPHVPSHVMFLKDIHRLMRKHPEPGVRSKFLACWDFHMRRFPGMLKALEAKTFSLAALAPVGAWRSEQRAMSADIRYFKRIGSGSKLSIGIGKRKVGSKSRP